MEPFATINDVKELWREMTEEETKRAEKLLSVVSDCLRVEADKVGKDLDAMIEQKPFLKSVAKSVTVDVVARTLMTSTDSEPLAQESQSHLDTHGPAPTLFPEEACSSKSQSYQDSD